MDGGKIAIEKQGEAADISINSGASWKGNVTEDRKPMIGLVTKPEMETVDKVGGDLDMKSECLKCHLQP